MNRKILAEINKEKEAVLAKLGKEYEMNIPSRGREVIDSSVGPPSEDVDGDPDYRDEYLERYEEVAGFYCRAFREGQARDNGRHHTATGEKRGQYQKPFERRLRLVEFVTARWARTKNNHFNWIQIASEWNKFFPIEQINPEVLRVEYSRAIRENDLMSHLLAMLCLKDRQTGEKPWGKDEFKQFFLETALDSTRKGEPLLSLMYKHRVLGGMSKQVPMNKKRVDIALLLAKKFREMDKTVKGGTK
ncbi:MAG TPA: hypothetical protein VMX96_04630 [Dehalococcoidia bacterium]|nr:hypothetical protein [Dehalococcoidia bacterium]